MMKIVTNDKPFIRILVVVLIVWYKNKSPDPEDTDLPLTRVL